MPDITEKAMVVALTISQWTARKHDKRVSDKIARENNTSVDAGRYNKTLIARDALKAISSVANEARTHHYTNTLPWADNGFRILPAANYWDYAEAHRAFRQDFHTAIARFRENYPDYIAEAEQHLGRLFEASDYPSPADIATKFDYEVRYIPLPDAQDFRVTLGVAEEAQIRADIERRVEAATQAAMHDLWRRIHDAVAHIRDRLNSYAVDPVSGKVSNPFRDSLVGNLRDLAELLPKLNITGDPELDEMRRRLTESLCDHEAQDLRDDAELRKEIARSADQILADMAGYVGSTNT